MEDTNDDNDEDEEEDDGESNLSIAAALAAAAWTSRGASETGRGSEAASWGKLRIAEFPLMLNAATSWALAAISGVGKVPSQIRDFLRGSRISDTHLPQFRILTPRYTGCLLESRILFIFFDSGSGFEELGRDWVEPGEDGDDEEEEPELELLSVSEFSGSAIVTDWSLDYRAHSSRVW